MELEHTNLGQHCEVAECNQRDFLPFKCDVCFRNFCLLHRTYNAHSCSGADSKDMTSLDCPICSKSVKFSKAESPDIVWDQHYTTSCAGTQSVKKPTKCYRQSCPNILGPTNTFNCPKCKQNVCLSHRVPEDHDCKGMRGTVLSKIAATTSTVKTTKATAATSGFAAAKPTKNNEEKRPLNSYSSTSLASNETPAKGGVERQVESNHGGGGMRATGSKIGSATPRMEPAAPISSTSFTDSFSCPFCNVKMANAAALTSHVNDTHPDPAGATTAAHQSRATPVDTAAAISSRPLPPLPSRGSAPGGATSSAQAGSGSGGAREVCPVCQAAFSDAVQLVSHFEMAHFEQAPPRTGSSGSTGTGSGGGGKGGRDCKMS